MRGQRNSLEHPSEHLSHFLPAFPRRDTSAEEIRWGEIKEGVAAGGEVGGGEDGAQRGNVIAPFMLAELLL